MKTSYRFNRWVVTFSCVALVVAQPVANAQELSARNVADGSRTLDVRLSDRGDFSGQIVNAAGHPESGARVELWRQGKLVSHSKSDESGQFRFTKRSAGAYQLLAPGARGAYRLWKPSAAPPAAQSVILLVQDEVIRAQYPPRGHGRGLYDGGVKSVFNNPWVFSGLLAAGIAVPIALAHNDDDDRDGS